MFEFFHFVSFFRRTTKKKQTMFFFVYDWKYAYSNRTDYKAGLMIQINLIFKHGKIWAERKRYGWRKERARKQTIIVDFFFT